MDNNPNMEVKVVDMVSNNNHKVNMVSKINSLVGNINNNNLKVIMDINNLDNSINNNKTHMEDMVNSKDMLIHMGNKAISNKDMGTLSKVMELAMDNMVMDNKWECRNNKIIRIRDLIMVVHHHQCHMVQQSNKTHRQM